MPFHYAIIFAFMMISRHFAFDYAIIAIDIFHYYCHYYYCSIIIDDAIIDYFIDIIIIAIISLRHAAIIIDAMPFSLR
jgi:hypothetical protein